MSEPDRSQSVSADHAPQTHGVFAESSAAANFKKLSDTNDEQGYCSAWLSLQCARIPGAVAALILIRQPPSAGPVVRATWPDPNLDLAELTAIAERAYVEGRTTVALGRTRPDTSPAQPVGLLVGVPLGFGKEPIAAAAVALTITGGVTLVSPDSVTERMRWGSGWLEALQGARRSNELSASVAQAAVCLDLFATIGEQSRFKGTALALVDFLATRLHCDRVSIGTVRKNGSMRIRAISHSVTFKNEGQLVDAIENAMEEAFDQGATVIFPTRPSDCTVAMAHRTLAEIVKAPSVSLVSVTLVDGKGTSIGAITLERHRDPFENDSLQLAETTAALLGPIIALQLRANRIVAGRAVDTVGDGFAAIGNPRRPVLKLAAIGVLGLALTLVFGTGEHRVTAKSVLEAEVQRAAVIPFDGYIRTASTRAGDTVRAGDLLAALDDRDLILDRLKWRAERDKLVQKHREVLAKHDRTNVVILESQIRQADSQVALAEEKLSRARIVAPFDGIVVFGDLTQMLGSPVEKGKLLFEIAPLNTYRLIVHVDERDVRYVAVSQTGVVAFAGMPWTPVPIVVRKITPVTVAEEGRNSFRVEATLTELGPHLRPGMEGVTKIETGQRSLVWIWTRALVEWARLVAWKYMP
jgi:Barrel-sandwich domain of CusB or HlyD membrane-fusion/GAF domain